MLQPYQANIQLQKVQMINEATKESQKGNHVLENIP